jgi:hypothetical protein
MMSREQAMERARVTFLESGRVLNEGMYQKPAKAIGVIADALQSAYADGVESAAKAKPIKITGQNADEPDGDLDEVFGWCHVHLERMSDQGFCLILDEPSGRNVIINLWTKRARIGAFVFADNLQPEPTNGGTRR